MGKDRRVEQMNGKTGKEKHAGGEITEGKQDVRKCNLG